MYKTLEKFISHHGWTKASRLNYLHTKQVEGKSGLPHQAGTPNIFTFMIRLTAVNPDSSRFPVARRQSQNFNFYS